MVTPVVMIDTIGASSKNIPSNALKVAGYVTGGNTIEWTYADWERFTKTAGIVQICQNSSGDPTQAVAFDIEPGALSIAEFVSMAKVRQNDHKWNSAAYIEASQVGDLVQALDNAKLTMVQLWIANWSLDEIQASALLGTWVRGFQIVAVQYASPSSNPNTVCPGSSKTLKELNLDLSVTLPTWFPAPQQGTSVKEPVVAPPAAVATLKGTLELEGLAGAHSVEISSTDDGKTWHIA